MRDRILDILGYLSQSLEEEKDLFYDSEEIWDHLQTRGYTETDIEGALDHIKKMSLEVPGPFFSDAVPVYRSYSHQENVSLSKKVRGYLWKLKVRGIIDHALEDEIVQKALNLDTPAGLREIKTVAALTIFGYEHKTKVEKKSSLPNLHLN